MYPYIILDPIFWTPRPQLETPGEYRSIWGMGPLRESLIRIRAMPSVESATLDGNGDLIIRTSRKLRHKKAWLPLAQVDIKIERLGGGYPRFKYTHGDWSAVFNAHPVMGSRRIGSRYFQYHCIGEYIYDYRKARKISVYATVEVLITMLQTIEKERYG